MARSEKSFSDWDTERLAKIRFIIEAGNNTPESLREQVYAIRSVLNGAPE